MASTLYPEVTRNQHVDLDTRKAVIAAQQGQALTPYQLTRLANRQAIDEENAQGASPIYGGADQGNARAMQNAAAAGAVGPRGIDVNSYSGSIYGPPGSAQPIPGYQPKPSADQAADALLRSRYGAPPNERGQIDIAGANGTRAVPSAAAMSVTASEPTADDSARNEATPGLMAPPYAPASQPTAPAAGPLASMLKSSRLDPGVRELGEQVTRANLEATRLGTQATASAIEDRNRSGAAARAAIEPGEDGAVPSGDEILRNYIRNGGRIDPSIITAAARPARETPRLVDVGGGRQALVGPAQLVPTGEQPKGAIVPIEVGGRKLAYHPDSKRYFDEAGKPVDFGAERAPRAPDPFLKSQDPELYEAQRAEYLEWIGRGKKSPEGKGADGAAPGAVVEVTSKEEFEKLPKGTKFNFNGRIGTKK